MKAPDKIYLGIGPMSGDEPNKRYLYAEWYEEPKPLVQNIEYIRKDALLEFAKEKKKQLLEQKLTNDEPSDVAAGINAGLDMLIWKLNSM